MVTQKLYQVYLVDDDQNFREATQELLESEDFATTVFDRAEPMLDMLDGSWPGVVLCDVRMPGMDGLEVLEFIRNTAPQVPVVMMTGHGDVPMAITSIKAGAYDFLEKPVQPAYLLSVLRRALNTRKLELENDRLRLRVERLNDSRVKQFGTSRVMKYCLKQLDDVAALPVSVLLHGEIGTGKELAAAAIHEQSGVSGGFLNLNCSTLTEEELSVAIAELTNQPGTLFLRFLEELSSHLQKLLSEYLRDSSAVRFIGSTTGNPEKHLVDGKLYPDLFYRFNVAIEMPPLRERGKDIFLLFERFMQDAAVRFSKTPRLLSPEQRQALSNYDWPGNVRELRNVAEQFVIGLNIDVDKRTRSTSAITSYDHAMEEFERSLLRQALIESNGHKGAAANLLSIPRKRLYLRLKSIGLS